ACWACTVVAATSIAPSIARTIRRFMGPPAFGLDLRRLPDTSKLYGEFLELRAIEGGAEAGRVAGQGLAFAGVKIADEDIVRQLVEEMRFGRKGGEARDCGMEVEARLGADARFGIGADHDWQAESLAERDDFQGFGE